MALTKSAMIRYQILDNCFRHPVRRFYIEDLIRECTEHLTEIHGSGSISRRQVLQDIAFMESSEGWSVELERHKTGRRVYYRYTDLAYSINNSPLNDLQLLQLKSAIQVLKNFSGLPQFGWLGDIFSSLSPLTTGRGDPHLVSFDNNQHLKGIQHFGEIFTAISYKQVLNVSYQPFRAEEEQHLVFHPYHLKEYNNRWFVFGRNEENGRMDWNLALDRITEINTFEDIAYVNDTADWEEYFEDVIGVTRQTGAHPVEVRLNFKGNTCHYVLTKPLHGSQRSRWLVDGELLEVDLSVIINTELERLLLSYGPQVEVKAPIELRQRIAEKLRLAADYYHGDTNALPI